MNDPEIAERLRKINEQLQEQMQIIENSTLGLYEGLECIVQAVFVDWIQRVGANARDWVSEAVQVVLADYQNLPGADASAIRQQMIEFSDRLDELYIQPYDLPPR